MVSFQRKHNKRSLEAVFTNITIVVPSLLKILTVVLFWRQKQVAGWWGRKGYVLSCLDTRTHHDVNYTEFKSSRIYQFMSLQLGRYNANSFSWPGANFIELLSNIKQTTSQNACILYESLAGNQRNLLSNFICWAALWNWPHVPIS